MDGASQMTSKASVLKDCLKPRKHDAYLGQGNLRLASAAVYSVLHSKGTRCGCRVNKSDEAEPAALAGIAVFHDLSAIQHSILRKVKLQGLLAARGYGVGKR